MEGTEFGHYRLVSLLGRGGMGEVWRAYDTLTDRVVAVKVLPQNLVDDEVFEQRFRREARAAAGLDEPHVVPIHRYGEIDGRLYVDMRLIVGEDLETLLAGGPLPAERAVLIIEQIARALHAAHQVGLIHRDVKPSNVLVTESDFAYLIDFGIARMAGETGLTSRGSMIGTWAYMAPERFTAGDPDSRSDVYALACVLHQALTGQRPFPGDSVERQVLGHLSTPPPQPSVINAMVPATLDAVIARGMAKDPEQRYATTIELADAARAAITDRTAVSTPTVPAAVALPPSAPKTLRYSDTPTTRIPPPRSVHTAPAEPLGDVEGPTTQSPIPAIAHPGVPPAQPRSRRRMALTGVGVLVTAVAVVLALALWPSHDTTSVSPGAKAPNTGPLTGRYVLDFAEGTSFRGGQPDSSEPAMSAIWDVRSTCRPNGCVATANAIGAPALQPSYILDRVGDRWLAMGSIAVVNRPAGSKRFPGCTFPADYIEVITLQPQPDGTLVGEYVASGDIDSCYSRRTVTAHRTEDIDPDTLPDPTSQPPRVVSPAEAFHGRYRYTETKEIGEGVATTWCLRTGTRCLSRFYAAKGDSADDLVFADGKWTAVEARYDRPSVNCPNTTDHDVISGEFPLPQPLQNPIALLSGQVSVSRQTACNGGAAIKIDSKFERTGD